MSNEPQKRILIKKKPILFDEKLYLQEVKGLKLQHKSIPKDILQNRFGRQAVLWLTGDSMAVRLRNVRFSPPDDPIPTRDNPDPNYYQYDHRLIFRFDMYYLNDEDQPVFFPPRSDPPPRGYGERRDLVCEESQHSTGWHLIHLWNPSTQPIANGWLLKFWCYYESAVYHNGDFVEDYWFEYPNSEDTRDTGLPGGLGSLEQSHEGETHVGFDLEIRGRYLFDGIEPLD